MVDDDVAGAGPVFNFFADLRLFLLMAPNDGPADEVLFSAEDEGGDGRGGDVRFT